MVQANAPNFGKYIVLQRIGVGGMAEIFKCRLPGIGGFDKLVVIKRILPDQVDDPNFLHMFLDEARIAANLNHPNIAQTYEIGETEGVPFIAMEFVNGPSFGQLLKAERAARTRNAAVSAKVMAGVCAGLHSAHNAHDSNGDPLALIHRDVTPHNILVSLDGIPKLVDFGVAKARGNLAVTQAGGLKGKIWYMAPEQFHGSEATLDRRVDVFGVGVCLYQAVTGKLPYHGTSEMEMIAAAAEGRFDKPSKLWPEIPPELERIILWAMEANRDKRCPDCWALHEALEAFTASGPYACSPKQVADYIRKIFPDFEQRPTATLGTGSFTPSGARPGPASTSSPSTGTKAKSSTGGSTRRSASGTGTGTTSRSGTKTRLFKRRSARVAAMALGMVIGLNGFVWIVHSRLAARTAKNLETAPVPQPIAFPSQPPAEQSSTSLDRPTLPIPEVDGQKDGVDTDDAEEATAEAALSRPAQDASAKATAARAAATRKNGKPAPPAPKKAGEGRLTVVTEPPAMVYLNDEPLGRSPIRNHPVKAGIHQLSTELSGYSRQERTVKVAAAKDALASLRLTREREITRDPMDALPPPSSAIIEDLPSAIPAPNEERPRDTRDRAVMTPDASMGSEGLASTSKEKNGHTVASLSKTAPELASGPLTCPEGTRGQGAAPPRGHAYWCELEGGQKHGPSLRWHPNGVKAEQGEFRNGKKHGRWIEWYENGSERERTEWRKGVKAW